MKEHTKEVTFMQAMEDLWNTRTIHGSQMHKIVMQKDVQTT